MAKWVGKDGLGDWAVSGEQIYDAQGPAKQGPFEDRALAVLQASCLYMARRKP